MNFASIVSFHSPSCSAASTLNAPHRIDTAARLEAAYHELIPISAHMQISVKSWEDGKLVLHAPLAANINHQGSGFGGSLFSIAALAGWGIIELALADLDRPSNTVIANTDVGYKRPVFEDFDCICELPETWDSCRETLLENGRASLILKPSVVVGDDVAMTLSGRYVISLT